MSTFFARWMILAIIAVAASSCTVYHHGDRDRSLDGRDGVGYGLGNEGGAGGRGGSGYHGGRGGAGGAGGNAY